MSGHASGTFHDDSIAAADDERRQTGWEQRGRRVERSTWDDVHVTPVKTIRRLRAAVASAA